MDDNEKALDKFFKSAVKSLDSAGKIIVAQRAERLKKITQGELKTKFRRKVGGVKVYNLEPRGDLGPAAYVSVKPAFLRIFEESGEILASDKHLVVRLPGAERLKLPRPGKRGFQRIVAENKHRFRWAKTANGWLVLCKLGKNKEVPVYLLTRRVFLRKRINFFDNAKIVANGMADEIAKLVEGRL